MEIFSQILNVVFLLAILFNVVNGSGPDGLDRKRSPGSSPSPAPEGFVRIEGDMMIAKERLDQLGGKFESKLWYQIIDLWPNPRKIPFVIDSVFDAAHVPVIMNALWSIENRTCIRFVQIGRQDQIGGYLSFEVQETHSCWAQIGYHSFQRTVVNIDPYWCDLGSIVHELCHSLGLAHTHSRPDRDKFVKVDTTMVDPEFGIEANYGIDTSTHSNTPYDYDSLMHYIMDGDYGVAIWAPVPIGQNFGLSPIDISELNFLYICEPNKVVCLHDLRENTTIGPGENLNVSFSVHVQGDSAAQVSFTPPAFSDQSKYTGILNSFDKFRVNHVASPLMAYKYITLEVTFTSVINSSQSATCRASVLVTPSPTPVNCHGYLPTDPNVCSGHGACVLTDVCECTQPYGGLNCENDGSFQPFVRPARRGSPLVFDNLPEPLDPYTPVYTPTLDVVEDYVVSAVESNVESFEFRMVMLPLRLSDPLNTLITFEFQYPNRTRVMSAHRYLQDVHFYNNTVIAAPSDFTTIPLKGRFRVRTDGPAYWHYGNHAPILGRDYASIGTRAKQNMRSYFRLYAVLRCKDGFYGRRCERACPGVSLAKPGAAQCNWYGICKDGPLGNGKCTCFAGRKGADCSKKIAVNCVGAFAITNGCSKTCGKGFIVKRYSVSRVAENGGKDCPYKDGATITASCSMPPCPVNCRGQWVTTPGSVCSVTCGKGALAQTFKITRVSQYNGTACTYSSGQTRTVTCSLKACSGAL